MVKKSRSGGKHPPGYIGPGRIGKRAIGAYLAPDLVDAIHEITRRDGHYDPVDDGAILEGVRQDERAGLGEAGAVKPAATASACMADFSSFVSMHVDKAQPIVTCHSQHGCHLGNHAHT